jgi:hypothetical protein
MTERGYHFKFECSLIYKWLKNFIIIILSSMNAIASLEVLEQKCIGDKQVFSTKIMLKLFIITSFNILKLGNVNLNHLWGHWRCALGGNHRTPVSSHLHPHSSQSWPLLHYAIPAMRCCLTMGPKQCSGQLWAWKNLFKK